MRRIILSGTLYAISAKDSYAIHIYLLDLKSSSHYQQGFDYAVLVGQLAVEAQQSFFKHVSRDKMALLHTFLDWLWQDYLAHHLPQYFADELKGIRDGGLSIGTPKSTPDFCFKVH